MATNAFLPFGNAGGANVATAADYSANSGYAAGYQSGVAQSKYLNFTWRQSSLMTAALGQMIADFGLVNAVDDGVVANLETALVAGIGGVAVGRLINVQVFSTPGTSTYTPTAGTKSVIVEVQGAGGAGGGAAATTSGQISAGAGGAGGGYLKHRMTSGFAGVSVTVGQGGNPIVGSTGGSGILSSFAGVSASGGGGGTGGTPSVPSTSTAINGGSSGGVGSGGNIINASGQNGQYAIYGGGATSGQGGGGLFGFGGSALSSSAGGVSSPSRGGGGGGGALQNASSAAGGGAGGSGLVIVWEYA